MVKKKKKQPAIPTETAPESDSLSKPQEKKIVLRSQKKAMKIETSSPDKNGSAKDKSPFSLYSSPRMKKKKKRRSKATKSKVKKKRERKNRSDKIQAGERILSPTSDKGKLKKIKIKDDEEEEDKIQPKRLKRRKRMTKEERRIQAIDNYRSKILKSVNPETEKEKEENAMVFMCEGKEADVSFSQKVSILQFFKLTRAPVPRCEFRQKVFIEREVKRKSILKGSKEGDATKSFKFKLKDVSVFRKGDEIFEDDLLDSEEMQSQSQSPNVEEKA